MVLYMTWMTGNQYSHVVITVKSTLVKQNLHAVTDRYMADLKLSMSFLLMR